MDTYVEAQPHKHLGLPGFVQRFDEVWPRDSIEEYSRRWRQSVTAWGGDCPLFVECREGEQMQGSPCCQWWWEQEMELDMVPPTVAVVSDGKSTSGSLSSVGGRGSFSG